MCVHFTIIRISPHLPFDGLHVQMRPIYIGQLERDMGHALGVDDINRDLDVAVGRWGGSGGLENKIVLGCYNSAPREQEQERRQEQVKRL